jgi:hypothetical protein
MPENVVPVKLSHQRASNWFSKRFGIDVPKSIETESFPSSVGTLYPFFCGGGETVLIGP